MEPLYDTSVQLVGWIDDDEDADSIWDDGLEWRAYIADGHAWSAATGTHT